MNWDALYTKQRTIKNKSDYISGMKIVSEKSKKKNLMYREAEKNDVK